MGLPFLRREKRAANSQRDGYSVLHASLTVVGDMETEGSVRIDGRLEGSIRRARLVVIGASASIAGSVSADEVIIGGAVAGNVEASVRVEVQPTAVITGDIAAGAVVIHEGSAVQGRLSIRPREVHAPAAAPDAAGRPQSATPRNVRALALSTAEAT
jgi:cytoskeletal protein CcmA (bactofilin family)